MEYRNCEQYVLDKLETVEKRNDLLKERLDNLQARYDRIEKRMNKIKEILNKHGEVRSFKSAIADGDTRTYINIDVNEWSSKYSFDKLIRFAHIKDESGVPYDQRVQENAELSDQEDNATIIRDEIPDPDDEPETCVDLVAAENNDTPNECDTTENTNLTETE